METTNKNGVINWLKETFSHLENTGVDIKNLEGDSHFLPNFCEAKMVINVVVIAEMLAIVISLVMSVPNRFFANYFEAFLQISIFILWIALCCAAALCLARNYLSKQPNTRALVSAYLILLCVTWIVNEAAVWILWFADKIPSSRPEWYAHFHVQNLTISAIINALMLGYFLAKRELKLRTISEAEAKNQALQSRIRPHFVFNTMNIIASLTRSDPKKAETAIEDMSDLFRMMLNEDENIVPIKKELEVAKKYIALEELRLDNRLTLHWDIGKFPRNAVVPILVLQPLLENAITYGIEPSAKGGVINVKCWEEDQAIHISISNTLPKTRGRKSQVLDENSNFTLSNIIQRLNFYYNNKAILKTTSENELFTVMLTLPVRVK